MKPYKIIRKTAFLIFIVFLSCACQRKEHYSENKVIARINGYELTASDFENEARIIRGNRDLSSNPEKAKQELLQEIINKKIFIQEAQKLNFDKQKYFMREIEHYWEQALLKLLFKQKSDELYRSIDVSQVEIEDIYKRMKTRFYAQILVLDDKFAAEMLGQPGVNFDQLKYNFRNNIINVQGPAWFSCGELPNILEGPLYLLKSGQVSVPIKYYGDWAVIRVLKQEDATLEPLNQLSEKIRQKQLERRKNEAIENWMEELKNNSKIKINSKVLNEVNL